MHPHLPLVIHGPARIQIPIPLRRLKRRRLPLIQRLRRLHIIVPIAKHRRLRLPIGPRRRMQPVRIHQRMPTRMLRRRRLDQPNILHPNPLQLRRNKLRRPPHVPRMLRSSRYRRNSQQRLQLLNKPPLVLLRKRNRRSSPSSSLIHSPKNILPSAHTSRQSETQVYETSAHPPTASRFALIRIICSHPRSHLTPQRRKLPADKGAPEHDNLSARRHHGRQDGPVRSPQRDRRLRAEEALAIRPSTPRLSSKSTTSNRPHHHGRTPPT